MRERLRNRDYVDYRCYLGRLYSPIWGEFGASICRPRLGRGRNVVVLGMISTDPHISKQRKPNQNPTDPLPGRDGYKELLKEGLQLPAMAQEVE
jgi:hypothetical protein